jgi:hypothetical protein
MGIVDQERPGLSAGLDNGLVAVPDQGAELVSAQIYQTFSIGFSSGAWGGSGSIVTLSGTCNVLPV